MFVLIAITALTCFTVFAVGNLKRPRMQTEKTGDAAANVPTDVKGLEVEVLQYGMGDREVKAGDYILVRYEGKLQNGTVFVSNLGQGEPFGFYIGQGKVIAGWDQGLIGMKANEKRRLTIDPELAYGETGSAALGVPADAHLTYEIHLLDIVD